MGTKPGHAKGESSTPAGTKILKFDKAVGGAERRDVPQPEELPDPVTDKEVKIEEAARLILDETEEGGPTKQRHVFVSAETRELLAKVLEEERGEAPAEDEVLTVTPDHIAKARKMMKAAVEGEG